MVLTLSPQLAQLEILVNLMVSVETSYLRSQARLNASNRQDLHPQWLFSGVPFPTDSMGFAQ